MSHPTLVPFHGLVRTPRIRIGSGGAETRGHNRRTDRWSAPLSRSRRDCRMEGTSCCAEHGLHGATKERLTGFYGRYLGKDSDFINRLPGGASALGRFLFSVKPKLQTSFERSACSRSVARAPTLPSWLSTCRRSGHGKRTCCFVCPGFYFGRPVT